MQEHEPRLDEHHVNQIDDVTEQVRRHPRGRVLGSLVGEGGAQSDAPSVVAVAAGYQEQPADVRFAWRTMKALISR